MLIGQPVILTPTLGVLRVALSAPSIRRLAAGQELGKCERRIFDKLKLILDYGGNLVEA